jgi:hypothetical protein
MDNLIAEAVERVRASGEELTGKRVHKALIAMGHPRSYSEVYQELISMGVLVADAGDEALQPRQENNQAGAEPPHHPPGDVDEMRSHQDSDGDGDDIHHDLPPDPAPAEEHPDPDGDPVARAERQLADAQQQLSAAETHVPQLEHLLAEAKSDALTAVNGAEVVRAALRLGVLRSDEDPEVSAVETALKVAQRAVDNARWSLQQARQRATQARQACQQAERRLAEAKREYLLQTAHPALWEAWQAIRHDPRQNNGSRGDLFRWKWEREQLEQQITQALDAAGV